MDTMMMAQNETGDDLEQYQQQTIENNYQSRFADNPRVQKLLSQKEPIHMSGQVIISEQRKVLWKRICVIGEDLRECLIEMSVLKLKFYIVALDLDSGKYHVIEMWKAQAGKILEACNKSMEKLMEQLEFKYGKLMIKDQNVLLQHQLYQPI
jgi:hypothetical protein